MPDGREDVLSGRGVADVGGAIRSGRAKTLAVRAEGGHRDSVAVLLGTAHFTSAAHLPDAGCAVRAGRQHVPAVRTEARRVDVPVVSERRTDRFPGGNIPDASQVV